MDALRWLARHQSKNGRWEAEGWQRHCKGQRCQGRGHDAGQSSYDVGVTATSDEQVFELQPLATTSSRPEQVIQHLAAARVAVPGRTARAATLAEAA